MQLKETRAFPSVSSLMSIPWRLCSVMYLWQLKESQMSWVDKHYLFIFSDAVTSWYPCSISYNILSHPPWISMERTDNNWHCLSSKDAIPPISSNFKLVCNIRLLCQGLKNPSRKVDDLPKSTSKELLKQELKSQSSLKYSEQPSTCVIEKQNKKHAFSKQNPYLLSKWNKLWSQLSIWQCPKMDFN